MTEPSEISPGPDRLAVRADYEGSELTVDEICKKHGVPRRQLEKWRKEEGWKPRRGRCEASPEVSRRDLVARLLALLERQVTQLEARMREDGAGEKEIALLGNLIRNLDKLTEMEKAHKKEHKTDKAAEREFEEMKRRIKERIAQLRNG